jgi:hypothetical protein
MIVGGVVVGALFAGRTVYRHREALATRLVEALGYEVADEPEPAPTLRFYVDQGEELSPEEYYLRDWRTWLRRFWLVWGKCDHCGRTRFCNETNVSRPAWNAAMSYFKALGLIEVEDRRTTVLVTDREHALRVIGDGVLLPLPETGAPERVSMTDWYAGAEYAT